ncbi:MAG TPA: YCF48-related protein, partial [Saprospiraceae bacterium]|nr:YCF48-related protein [Saprospiraceae bacterium]
MDAGQSWVKAYEQGELTGLEVYIFNDLFFTNEQRGFAVGYDFFGADYLILRTTDGGSSWSPYTYEFGFNIGQCWSLDFLDHQNGYVVGDWGRIFKTTDGGTNWLPLGTPSNTRLTDVDFVSPQLGWVLSIEGALMKTTDGAGTWQVQSTPVEFNRIQFLNADLGFALADSRFFKTTDGGANWLPVSEPLPAGTVEFQFIDSQNGFSFVGNRAIITNDGGQTWFYQQVTPNLASGDFGGFNDISILNEHVGYMAGFQNNDGVVNTLLAQTENGGGIGL